MRNSIGFFIFGFGLMCFDGLINGASLDLSLAVTHSSIVGVIHNQEKLQSNISSQNATDSDFSYISNEHKPYCARLAASATIVAYYVPGGVTSLIYPLILMSISSNRKSIMSLVGLAVGILLVSSLLDATVLIIGICLLSINGRIYNITIMILAEKYDSQVAIKSYGAGAGFGVLFGAVGYSFFRQIASAQLLILLSILLPIILMIIQFRLIRTIDNIRNIDDTSILLPTRSNHSNDAITDQLQINLSFQQLFEFLPKAAPYFMPTFLSYVISLIANDSYELIYFPGISLLDRAIQYRLTIAVLSIGFLCGSWSIQLFNVKRLWLITLGQYIACTIFLLHVSRVIYLPSFFIVLADIFLQGILTGLVYVNSINEASRNFDGIYKQYAVSFVFSSLASGMIVGSVGGMFARNNLCKLYI